jgi:F0F1-type ATP synthase assembly protein I
VVDNKDLFNHQRKYGNLMSLGFQLAAGIAGFVLLGYFIDQKRGQDKIAFTILGMLLGFSYCAYEIWKLVKKLNEK